MFNRFFGNKNYKKIVATVLNSKTTYIILLLIILIQFMLVSIIFLQNKKSKYLEEQTNFKSASIENRLKQIDEKINILQSNVMRLQVQLYRVQGQAE